LPAEILDFSKFRHRWIVGSVGYSYPASEDRQGGNLNPGPEGNSELPPDYLANVALNVWDDAEDLNETGEGESLTISRSRNT
jgi:hypothetical protein